ncbi:unnamed protein product [Ixodes persulcatus]
MSGRGQLFIGRLPLECRERDVEQVFERYGRLLRCDVKYGTGMAYAFVDYEDHRDAEWPDYRCVAPSRETLPKPRFLLPVKRRLRRRDSRAERRRQRERPPRCETALRDTLQTVASVPEPACSVRPPVSDWQRQAAYVVRHLAATESRTGIPCSGCPWLVHPFFHGAAVGTETRPPGGFPSARS